MAAQAVVDRGRRDRRLAHRDADLSRLRTTSPAANRPSVELRWCLSVGTHLSSSSFVPSGRTRSERASLPISA